MTNKALRIGQIVPSSNITMETEIPAMFRAREEIFPEKFTFHSSRMRMKKVTKEELAAMDADSDRCALELSDAKVDVLGYACLVAIMSMGKGYHRESQKRLQQRTVDNGAKASVVTSAGALIEGLQTLQAKKIAIVTPYMKPLTAMVVDYIESEGIEVVDSISLEIADNIAVGEHDPALLPAIAKKLKRTDADVVVLSACVQMPSLPVVQLLQDELQMPVTTAAICTVYRMLQELKLQAQVPDCGALLSGAY